MDIDNEIFSIFTESSESKGLLYDSYNFLNERITKFLDVIEDGIKRIKKDPINNDVNIREDITKFKNDVNITYSPSSINIREISKMKSSINKYRTNTDAIFKRYTKLRRNMAFGGNYIHGILMKSRAYSKDINPEHYDKINKNVRNIDRALDWVEKILIDLFNMIDQDLNILTIIRNTYGKHKIYENSEDILDSKIYSMEQDCDINYLNENWIFIENDLRININEWKPGNPLWITGSSGDGKSTLAEKMASSNNAICITSDIVLCRMAWSKEKFEETMKEENSESAAYKMNFKDNPAVDYVLSHPELPYNAKDPKTKCVDDSITEPEMIKFYLWLMKESVINPKYKDKLYVVEGCDICLMDPVMMTTKPLIIVGGSRIRSLFRRAKRDSIGKNRPIIKSIFKYIRKYKFQNQRLDDNKDIFRKNIGKNIKENVYKEYNDNCCSNCGITLDTKSIKDVPKKDYEKATSEFPNWDGRYGKLGMIECPKCGKRNYIITGNKRWDEGVNIMEDDLSWIDQYIKEEGEDLSAPPSLNDESPEEKKSMPKQTDAREINKNGVRRKKLYIAFIEWAKACNSKNTFGSIFDKDIFNVTYPFVPNDMRYFYRLANPILCVLSGDLTFFQVSELRKLNAKNSKINEMLIFAATPNDMRVFNIKDKKIYRGIDENGSLTLKEIIGDTFDLYIQNMIKQGDILNGPVEESYDMEFI